MSGGFSRVKEPQPPRNGSGPRSLWAEPGGWKGKADTAPASSLPPTFPQVPAPGAAQVLSQKLSQPPHPPFPSPEVGSLRAPDPYSLFPIGTQGARVMEKVRQGLSGAGRVGGRGVARAAGEVGEPRWSGNMWAGGHTASLRSWAPAPAPHPHPHREGPGQQRGRRLTWPGPCLSGRRSGPVMGHALLNDGSESGQELWGWQEGCSGWGRGWGAVLGRLGWNAGWFPEEGRLVPGQQKGTRAGIWPHLR